MASGGSQDVERYRGGLGGTRRERVHYSCACGARHVVEVLTGINAEADPLLGRRLLDGDASLTVCPVTGARASIHVPLVYHDPRNRLFILVLPDGARTRELAERAALLGRLAEDTAQALPSYVVDFGVVFGPDGLRRFLEAEAERALDAGRAVDRGEKGRDQGTSGPALVPAGSSVPGPPGPPEPVERAPTTDPFTLATELDADDEPEIEVVEGIEALEMAEGLTTLPMRAVTGDVITSAAPVPPPLVSLDAAAAEARWPGGRDPVIRRMVDGAVELLVRTGGAELEALSGDTVEVRIQLHRMMNYPVITFLVGAPGSLSGAAGAAQPLWVPLDFAAEADRAQLTALGRSFELTIDLYDRDRGDRRALRRRHAATLADNVRCALSAAVDYLKRVPSAERSFARAVTAFLSPDHDRLGLKTSYAGELDDAVLESLSEPHEVLRAIALVRRFSQPAGEDWLVLTRGYSMELWQARRRAVVERAVELGLWAGPVAAQIAVSEGLARSRKELVVRLQRSFAGLVGGEATHGLDDTAVRDNWESLKGEASALGLPPSEWANPRSEPIMSESVPIASGTIGHRAAMEEMTELLPTLSSRDRDDDPTGRKSVDGEPGGSNGQRARDQRLSGLDDAGLIALLGERTSRMNAAIELCRRGEASSAKPLFAALEHMSRGEASRVLGSVVGLGRAAEPHLMAGIRNKKGFLRQGAALALAVLRSEAGLEAICDLLLDEPSEIWREVARALGETGPGAVMPLAARLVRRPPSTHERVAWALAHIAARGARRPIETLAAGRDPVAAGVARRALELASLAASDHLQVSGADAPRDQTVNRAFSRRFFEAMRSDNGGSQGTEGTSPAMLLDDADVLEAVDLDAEDSGVEVEVTDADLEEGESLPGRPAP